MGRFRGVAASTKGVGLNASSVNHLLNSYKSDWSTFLIEATGSRWYTKLNLTFTVTERRKGEVISVTAGEERKTLMTLTWSFSLSQEPQNSGNEKNHTKVEFPACESYLQQCSVWVNCIHLEFRFKFNWVRFFGATVLCNHPNEFLIVRFELNWHICSLLWLAFAVSFSPKRIPVFLQLAVWRLCQSTVTIHCNKGWQGKVLEEGRREGLSWKEAGIESRGLAKGQEIRKRKGLCK